MIRWCVILMLCMLASPVAAAEAVKIRTLAGKSVEGDLLRVSDKGITVRTQDGAVSVGLGDALDVTFPNNSVAISDSNYSDVELIDGTLLHCTEVRPKGNALEVKLLSGQEMKLPLRTVLSYLRDAQEPNVRQEWQGFLSKKGTFDLLGVRDKEGKLNVLEGTFGEGNDKGTAIAFETSAGLKRELSLSRIHAMAFVRKEPVELPPAVCKVHDTSRDVLVAAGIQSDGDRFSVKTVSGGQVGLTAQGLLRLDFSNGKLTYLSDLEPTQVSEVSNVGLVEHFHRDKNLDNGPLKLVVKRDGHTEAQNFNKGLSVHATTELSYDLGGEFNEFKAVIGVDPTVGGDGRAKIIIDGDGRELFSAEMQSNEPAHPVACNIKGVRVLHIRVTHAGLLDLGNHIELADAKVSK